MHKRRIVHFAPVFQATSGVSTFVGEIANIQSSLGWTVAIATLPRFVKGQHYHVADSIRIVDMAHGIGWGSSPPDIVHIHGLWTVGLHKVVSASIGGDVPIVWSPHGMLAPWAMHHKWWKKWPAWWLWQKRDFSKAGLIHATTDLEASWIRDLGLDNELSVVPLGTSLPDLPNGPGKKRLLFVGRLYPVKGLENLVRAWSAIDAGRRAAWTLRLVGPDQAGYGRVLERLVGKLNLGGSVELAGPKYGEELRCEYDECSCLVLPSFTENFGAAVVDALAHGKPCIASTFTPWRELEEHGCGWWVSNEPDELARTIAAMMDAGESVRRQMGEKGRALVAKKYTWPAISQKMAEAYERICRSN